MEETFGRRLQLAIDARASTHVALAEQLEVAPTRVSEWVNGKWIPKGSQIIQIVEALRIDAHWLLTGEGSMDRQGEAQLRLEAVREALTAPIETLSGRDLGKGKIR
jgi:transcriptional regulator with XRE-family HTH domain